MISRLLKFLAGLVMGFVVIALPIVLLIESVGSILFSQSKMVKLVEDTLNREMLAEMASASVREWQGNPNSGFVENLAVVGFKNFEQSDWVNFFELVAPPSVTSQTVGEVLNGFYVWLDSDTLVLPVFQIDLRGWKGALTTNAIPVTQLVFGKMPECSADQMLAFGLSGDYSVANLPLCRPGEPVYGGLMEKVSILVPSVLANYDDDYTINTGLAAGQNVELIETFKRQLRNIRTIFQYGWLAVGLIFFVGILMGARSLKEMLRWSGTTLLWAGAGTLGGALILVFLKNQVITIVGGMLLQDVSGSWSPLINSMINSSVNMVSQPLLLEGVVLIVIGIGGIFAAAVVRNYLKKRKGASLDKTDDIYYNYE